MFQFLKRLDFHQFQGQTESKRSTKVRGPETKGTAMSFGFKKKQVYTGTTKKILVKPETGIKIESDDNGNTGESRYYVIFYRYCYYHNRFLFLSFMIFLL